MGPHEHGGAGGGGEPRGLVAGVPGDAQSLDRREPRRDAGRGALPPRVGEVPPAALQMQGCQGEALSRRGVHLLARRVGSHRRLPNLWFTLAAGVQRLGLQPAARRGLPQGLGAHSRARPCPAHPRPTSGLERHHVGVKARGLRGAPGGRPAEGSPGVAGRAPPLRLRGRQRRDHAVHQRVHLHGALRALAAAGRVRRAAGRGAR
mmetsp:Transcript_53998/g.167364  ORF Transcript_53998/g.167364 Transcript_53998/m.167364 type:complete len:205 (-) Transcript_53998:199-813(-)